jgi:uncharacterized protein (TIGR01777 family)
MGDNNRKRLIITGATGFIGQHLYNNLKYDYETIIFTGNIKNARKILGENVKAFCWDGNSVDHIIQYIEGAHAIINLAGENIGTGRWTKRKKDIILNSRIRAGSALSRAIKKTRNKPEVFIQASATGYYGLNAGKGYDEMTDIKAEGFLAEVTRNWEKAVNTVNSDIRFIIIRLGNVLGKDGGILGKILISFKFFMGGYPGKGEKWFSWIHITDAVNAISFLLKNNKSTGIYNLTSPNPVKYKDLAKNIGKLIKRPSWLSFPEFVLILFLGQRARELLLSDIRVYPKRLTAENFKFSYKNIEEALYNILESYKH